MPGLRAAEQRPAREASLAEGRKWKVGSCIITGRVWEKPLSEPRKADEDMGLSMNSAALWRRGLLLSAFKHSCPV